MVHVSCTIQGKRKYSHLYMCIAVAFLKISMFVKTRFKNTSNRGRFEVEKIRWIFQLHQLQLLRLWDGWVCSTGLRSPAPTYFLAAAAILVDPWTYECRLLTASEYTEWKLADKSMSLIPVEGLLVISECVSVGCLLWVKIWGVIRPGDVMYSMGTTVHSTMLYTWKSLRR